MAVIGIVGSPRINGNTEIITNHTLNAIAEEGFATELVHLAKLDIRPCTACRMCTEGEKCSIDDDLFHVYNKMKEAEGIIFASPVYCGSATALIKALMERTSYMALWNGQPFRNKVGGSIAVARRGGHNFTLAQLNFWFQAMGMIVPGSTYWNMAIAQQKGDVNEDKEGLQTAWQFGKNLAALLKCLNTNS